MGAGGRGLRGFFRDARAAGSSLGESDSTAIGAGGGVSNFNSGYQYFTTPHGKPSSIPSRISCLPLRCLLSPVASMHTPRALQPVSLPKSIANAAGCFLGCKLGANCRIKSSVPSWLNTRRSNTSIGPSDSAEESDGHAIGFTVQRTGGDLIGVECDRLGRSHQCNARFRRLVEQAWRQGPDG